ncbi:YcnI family protein [Cryobacterium tagatosivorans]|nr:YcnI family protein [Cryobacterium tagatosivorans]
MKLTTPALTMTTIAAGAFLAVAAPLSASAHISADPTETAAGSSSVITFALPHGCDGSATTAISIGIPEGVLSVTPTAKPGWTVTEVAADLAAPAEDADGNPVTTRTGSVVYTAGTPLADGLRDTFSLSLPLPADAAGTTLDFPVVQTCEKGETRWDQTATPGEEEPERPAPAITVTEATGDEHGHAEAASDDHAADGDAAGHAEPSAAGAPAGDVLARVLGIGGLAVGAVGIILAVAARRRPSA